MVPKLLWGCQSLPRRPLTLTRHRVSGWLWKRPKQQHQQTTAEVLLFFSRLDKTESSKSSSFNVKSYLMMGPHPDSANCFSLSNQTTPPSPWGIFPPSLPLHHHKSCPFRSSGCDLQLIAVLTQSLTHSLSVGRVAWPWGRKWEKNTGSVCVCWLSCFRFRRRRPFFHYWQSHFGQCINSYACLPDRPRRKTWNTERDLVPLAKLVPFLGMMVPPRGGTQTRVLWVYKAWHALGSKMEHVCVWNLKTSHVLFQEKMFVPSLASWWLTQKVSHQHVRRKMTFNQMMLIWLTDAQKIGAFFVQGCQGWLFKLRPKGQWSVSSPCFDMSWKKRGKFN